MDLNSATNAGRESEWILFARLRIESGKLGISSPMFFRDLPLRIEVPVGYYQVFAKTITYQDDTRVSRLRAVLETDHTPKLGRWVDYVAVDFGRVGVFDLVVLNEVGAALSEEKEVEIREWFEKPFRNLYSVGMFDENREVTMPAVEAGYGDGAYPVFELLDGSGVVGAEVVFIGPEADHEY